ncbi:MAG: acyl-CoA dehydrogenase family protein [Candidatus Coatesbacteria bacterium]|nr:MAG: acyl-CoA dehydrogenase family protein [Candidatus Coatesbacteria bacterium]
MDYLLTEEQLEIRDLCRDIAKKSVLPVAEHYDRSDEFPWEIMEVFAKADLFRIFIPEEYEGLGLGVTELCIATEELSRACSGITLGLAGTALGTEPILVMGNDEQKAEYLPRIANGALAAFSLTEADSGSDAAGIRTKAVKDGDYYVLNGTKQWVTNGGEAEIYTVIVSTNPERGARGLSAFIIEKGTPGFEFGKKEDKMGIRASATRELVFTDCKVPAKNRLGKEGTGFITVMRTFDHTRPGVAAQAVGIAQGAFDWALIYSKERRQFGQPISAFQGIQFKLADMSTKIEAARALTYSVARMVDAGVKDTTRYSAQAKVFASDVAMEVTTDAIQILGGYGYMREFPVEKYFRDAKITQIYEGTNEIQRMIIGRDLIRTAGEEVYFE